MIQITCSKCEVVLTIDDAFAGGVCRCQHCGTIQTVPRELKTSGNPTAGRALMSKSVIRLPDEVPSLDELEQIVASSGLAGTSFSGTGLIGTGLAATALPGTGLAAAGLAESRLTHAVAAPEPLKIPKNPPTINLKFALILGACGLGLFLLGMLAAWLIMHNSHADSSSKRRGRSDSLILRNPDESQPSLKPNFMGIDLKGPTVIYLLDRGEGSANAFEYMKRAATDSVGTLSNQMTFQVIFWETDRVIVWPPEGTTPAVKKNIDACRNMLAGVHPSGQSSLGPALNRALLAKPTEIILATGQEGLGDEFVQMILATRNDPKLQIHAISMGDGGSPTALKAIAQQTRGQFRSISSAELEIFED